MQHLKLRFNFSQHDFAILKKLSLGQPTNARNEIQFMTNINLLHVSAPRCHAIFGEPLRLKEYKPSVGIALIARLHENGMAPRCRNV